MSDIRIVRMTIKTLLEVDEAALVECKREAPNVRHSWLEGHLEALKSVLRITERYAAREDER